MRDFKPGDFISDDDLPNLVSDNNQQDFKPGTFISDKDISSLLLNDEDKSNNNDSMNQGLLGKTGQGLDYLSSFAGGIAQPYVNAMMNVGQGTASLLKDIPGGESGGPLNVGLRAVGKGANWLNQFAHGIPISQIDSSNMPSFTRGSSVSQSAVPNMTAAQQYLSNLGQDTGELGAFLGAPELRLGGEALGGAKLLGTAATKIPSTIAGRLSTAGLVGALTSTDNPYEDAAKSMVVGSVGEGVGKLASKFIINPVADAIRNFGEKYKEKNIPIPDKEVIPEFEKPTSPDYSPIIKNPNVQKGFGDPSVEWMDNSGNEQLLPVKSQSKIKQDIINDNLDNMKTALQKNYIQTSEINKQQYENLKNNNKNTNIVLPDFDKNNEIPFIKGQSKIYYNNFKKDPVYPNAQLLVQSLKKDTRGADGATKNILSGIADKVDSSITDGLGSDSNKYIEANEYFKNNPLSYRHSPLINAIVKNRSISGLTFSELQDAFNTVSKKMNESSPSITPEGEVRGGNENFSNSEIGRQQNLLQNELSKRQQINQQNIARNEQIKSNNKYSENLQDAEFQRMIQKQQGEYQIAKQEYENRHAAEQQRVDQINSQRNEQYNNSVESYDKNAKKIKIVRNIIQYPGIAGIGIGGYLLHHPAVVSAMIAARLATSNKALNSYSRISPSLGENLTKYLSKSLQGVSSNTTRKNR